MPKVIQPRRQEKTLSAEEFWAIREQQKQKAPEPQVYRSLEVASRHRFTKPSEQANNFRPLAYFFTQNRTEGQQDIFSQEADSHLGQYLKSVQGRVSPTLAEIKRLCAGHKSILHNREKIFGVLWKCLNCEDSWDILQALTKDCEGKGLSSWLNGGLTAIGEEVTRQVGNSFSLSLFGKIFNSICVFMESHFKELTAELNDFFLVFAGNLLKHPNKYLRKFSLESFSYIMGNLDNQAYSTFLNFLLQLHQQQFFNSNLPLPALLVQRLSILRGCLTTPSLGFLLSQLQHFRDSLDPAVGKTIAADYIYLILSQLNPKGAAEAETVLFDLNSVLEAIIKNTIGHSDDFKSVLLAAFSRFITLAKSEPRRFDPRTPRESESLGRSWQIFCSFFQSSGCLSDGGEVSLALAILASRNTKGMLFSREVIEYYRQHPEAVQTLVQYIHNQVPSPSQSLLQMLVLLCKQALSEFYLQGKHQQTIYRLILCLKRNPLPFLELASLSIDLQSITRTLHSQGEQHSQLLITLRALTLLKIEGTQSLIDCLNQLRKTTLQPYEQYLESLLHDKAKLLDKHCSPEEYYNWTQLVRQIIVYSHHQIGWLKQVFDLHQAFCLLFQHLHSQPTHSPIWNQLLVNRPSALALPSSSHSPEQTLALVGSRNRKVRLCALNLIKNNYKDSQDLDILRILTEIDQDDVNLDNEREVKRNLAKLEQLSNVFGNQLTQQRQALLTHLLQWCLGFAFTGFKLIETPFVQLLTQLLTYAPHIITPILIPFLQYYNYKHSRQFQADISPHNPQRHLANQFPCHPQPHDSLIAEDLDLIDLETVEWIGLERVAAAMKASPQGKTNLHDPLSAIIEAYFSVEFCRHSKSIRDSCIEKDSQLLLPPKTRFLGVILNLSHHNFMPPVSCLHYLRKQYFQVGAVREVKRHHWQSLWEKVTQKGKKEKNERIQSSVKLDQLSPIEEEMYLHYLWKEILEGSHHHKRVVLEHLRNELPHLTPKLLPLLLDNLHLKLTDSTEQTAKYLGRNNKKVLLNHMFIIKSMLEHLRNELDSDQEIEKVCKMVHALIQVVHPNAADPQRELPEEIEHQEKEQAVDDEEGGQKQGGEVIEQMEVEQEQEGRPKLSPFQLYKPHRKELYKLLQTLFTTHHLSQATIQSLLTSLLLHTHINLPKACRLSVPGLLHVIVSLSQQKEHCLALVEAEEGRIMSMLGESVWVDQEVGKPLAPCANCWLQIMGNVLLPIQKGEMSNEEEQRWQKQINTIVTPLVPRLLYCTLSYLSSGSSFKNDKQHQKMLSVIHVLMEISPSVPATQWTDYLLNQLSTLAKNKHKMNQLQFERLSLLLKILTTYFKHNHVQVNPTFLKKVITLLPHLKDLEQRQQLLGLLAQTHQPFGLSPQTIVLTQKLSDISRNGLVVTLNFTSFFQANAEYSQNFTLLQPHEHQFFIHVLLAQALNEELPVRRAVNQTLRTLASNISTQVDSPSAKLWGQIMVRIARTLLQLINKPQEEPIFWSLVEHLEVCFSWISTNSIVLSDLLTPTALSYSYLFPPNRDFLQGLVSLSEANKLKALKQLRQVLQEIKLNEEQGQSFRIWNQGGSQLPHPIFSLIFPILSYLIIRPQQTKSNLASSLAVVSLQMLPLLSNLLPFSLLKKELKRLVSRLRFSDVQSKSNVAVIKMVGQLLEGVPGQTVAEQLSSFIEEHGFQNFHQKLTLNRDIQEDDEPEEQEQGGKQKIPDFFDRLQELEEEEAVNRNFLNFEKKMMELDAETEAEGDIAAFLRKQVLPPLRALLTTGQRAKEEEEVSKSRVLLSVTTVQVLLRLPLDTFLREFQKVVGRLVRFLKKRTTETREYARGCLCAIAKATGHQLLYSIVNSLQFHLKDNFDKHVLNYTLFKILEGMNLSSGQLDYCLPLILPAAVDELWGRTGDEKDMVARREAPTLKMEARKRKGLDLFQLVFTVIGKTQLNYCIDFLEKYLCQHLTSEDSLGKYDQLLGALGKGLANNPEITDPSNAILLLEAVAVPLNALRSHLRWLNSENSGYETQQVQEWRVRKADKDSTLSLQEEAGRNRSIFARLSLQVAQRKNKQTVTAALIQFHLTVLSLLIRKQVISPSTAPSQGGQLLTIIGFLVDCLDQRDNRLVTKSLKVLHLSLPWKNHLLPQQQQSKMLSLRRQASRKILSLAQGLTLADEDLLKESFVFLNDLISEAAVNLDTLPSFVGLVKIHLGTSDDQPQLAEVYKLLRTLLVKSPLFIYHPLVEDLHSLLKVQLVTTSDREVRELARSCLSLYVRDRGTLQASIDLINELRQRQGRAIIEYSKKIKEEVTFCLSNLEGRGQEVILQLLQEWIEHRDKQEVQEYSELIVLSVMTARTNQLAEQASIENYHLKSIHPSDSLIQQLMQKIDKQKVKSMGEKCLLWARSPKNTPIRLCGVSLLTFLLPLLPSLHQDALSSSALILKEQLECLKERQAFEKREGKIDPQWAGIMDQMDQEKQGEICDLSSIQCLRNVLHISGQAKNLVNNETIYSIWSLLMHSHVQIQELALSICLCFQLLAALSQEQSQCNYAPKKIINKLIFSQIEITTLQQLLSSLLAEELATDRDQILKEISQLLLNLALKAHIKPKAFERSLPRVLTLINNVLLAEELAGKPLRQLFLEDNQLRRRMLEMTLKLNSNTLISSQAQALSAQTSELIKNQMGANQYFREVSQFEEEKRTRKQEESARKAQLTLLDPEALGQDRKKKRKLQ